MFRETIQMRHLKFSCKRMMILILVKTFYQSQTPSRSSTRSPSPHFALPHQFYSTRNVHSLPSCFWFEGLALPLRKAIQSCFQKQVLRELLPKTSTQRMKRILAQHLRTATKQQETYIHYFQWDLPSNIHLGTCHISSMQCFIYEMARKVKNTNLIVFVTSISFSVPAISRSKELCNDSCSCLQHLW